MSQTGLSPFNDDQKCDGTLGKKPAAIQRETFVVTQKPFEQNGHKGDLTEYCLSII